jgi:ATPase
MSVHIQTDLAVLAKQGQPGWWKMVEREESFNDTAIKSFIQDLLTLCSSDTTGSRFLEIDRPYSKVLQIDAYRIVIVLQPLSNITELTIVRPIKKLSYGAYQLEEQYSKYILEVSKGILIAGAPGEGKTTFTQAFAEEILKQGVIMKTIEAPRDLNLPKQVTQYSLHYSTHSEIRDILLLSRPDYSILDEIRNKDDFHLYKDLRLTGIWLIGVIHATKPVDAVQRLLSAVDIGVVAQVIDTVIFIKAGKVHTILTIDQAVKVPAGMQSDDLARPVVLIKNLITGQAEYEIYTFSDHVIVMPLSEVGQGQKSSPIFALAQSGLGQTLRNELWFLPDFEINSPQSITIYVPDHKKGMIIGREWATIKALETALWLSISIRTKEWEDTGDLWNLMKDNFRKKDKKKFNNRRK